MRATVHELHPNEPGRAVLRILPPGLGAEHPYRCAFEQFRHKWYCGVLGYEPARNDGRERDLYDRYSTYVIVTENDKVVGGCRIVPSFSIADPLPMEERREFEGIIERPCVELSRMIVGRKVNLHTINELYRGIYATLGSAHLFGGPIVTACATVEPNYLSALQARFSKNAFVVMGEGGTIQAKTGTGKQIVHIVMRICMEAWRECFLSLDVENAAQRKEMLR